MKHLEMDAKRKGAKPVGPTAPGNRGRLLAALAVAACLIASGVSVHAEVTDLTELSLEELMEKKPEDVVYRAVKGMMPHTKLGRQQLRKLRVYAGTEHKQQAQNPQPIENSSTGE